ncbi:MAG TPA: Spy/CpxP family protein refolding chaperone [Pyrinomonadaceae bacterium]|nr:Spy/CpxP family protein refolding chaperone [Pyrinomonadaceae bacterium]
MNKLGKLKTLTIASLSAVAIAAPIAYAQSSGSNQENQQITRGEHRGGHKGGKGWGGEFGRGGRGMRGGMFRGIELTEDQKTRMKQISDSFRERTQSLHQQLRAKHQELRQASEGGTFNEALATQKLTEAAGLRAKLMGEQFKMRQEIQSVLTAEQKTQLEQKRAEFKAKRGERSKTNVQ